MHAAVASTTRVALVENTPCVLSRLVTRDEFHCQGKSAV